MLVGGPQAALLGLLESGTYPKADASLVRSLLAEARARGKRPEALTAAIASVAEAYVRGRTDQQRRRDREAAGQQTKRSLDRRGAEQLLSLARRPATAALLPPLIGDPSLDWPFDEPFTLSDPEALKWLPVVARATVVTDAIRRFVRVMFCTTRRETWRPASRAIADLALRDGALADELAAVARDSFPNGLVGLKRFGLGARNDKDALTADYKPVSAFHRSRHVYVALCDAVARGGVIGGFSLDQLLAVSTAAMDDTDLSIVLLGWIELLRLLDGRARQQVVTAVASLGHESLRGASLQSEILLREMAVELVRVDPASAVAQDLIEFLCAPRWKARSGDARIDALWSWLETAAWCGHRGMHPELSRMRTAAKEAAQAFRLAVDGELPDGAVDVIDAVLPRLAVILDAARWQTTPEPRRAVLIVELLRLLDVPEVRAMPWSALVARCGGRSVGRSDRAAARTHQLECALLIVDRGSEPAVLLRDLELDEAALLRLAASDSGFIARQAAVQAERLLRGRSPADQLRLLWRILQENPKTRMLEHLASALRDEGTPLHQLVDALKDLDVARGDRKSPPAPTPVIAAQYNAVADAAQLLCSAPDGSAPGDRLKRIAASFDGLANSRANPGSREWLEQVRRLLCPADSTPGEGARGTPKIDDPGLIAWLSWVAHLPSGNGEPVDPCPRARERIEAWAALETSAVAAFEAEPYMTVEQCRQVAGALERLVEVFTAGSWPETLVLERFKRGVHLWRQNMEARAARREAIDARARRLLNGAEEVSLIELLHERPAEGDIGVPSLLSADTATAVHRFLLDRRNYQEADWLRGNIGARPVRRAMADARVADLVAAGNEKGLVDLLGRPPADDGVEPLATMLTPGTLVAAHQYLLECLNYRVADRLRRRVSNHVKLPRGVLTRMPLFAGALAGIWIVMDVAPDWEQLGLQAPYQAGVTILGSHLAALGLIAVLVMRGGWGRTAAERVTRTGRLLRVYAEVAALALGSTGLLMFLLAGTGAVDTARWPAQFGLWSALALFLGIFLGLILQGRAPESRR